MIYKGACKLFCVNTDVNVAFDEVLNLDLGYCFANNRLRSSARVNANCRMRIFAIRDVSDAFSQLDQASNSCSEAGHRPHEAHWWLAVSFCECPPLERKVRQLRQMAKHSRSPF